MLLDQNDICKIMTFRNRYLFIVFALVSIFAMIHQWRNHYREVDNYDTPRSLSGLTRTILLRHTERSCDCPDWKLVSRPGDSSGMKSGEFVYIEAGYAGMDVTPAYWALADSGYVLKLTGQFYKGEAIPYDYTQKTDQKPEKARVFYYTATEVVKPE